MEPDLSQCLVARKGELITCPECRADLVEILADWTLGESAQYQVLDAGLQVGATFECRCCGGFPSRPLGTGEMIDYSRLGPQLHMRSAAWSGWRDLGGE